jgi:hypothetical protein
MEHKTVMHMCRALNIHLQHDNQSFESMHNNYALQFMKLDEYRTNNEERRIYENVGPDTHTTLVHVFQNLYSKDD